MGTENDKTEAPRIILVLGVIISDMIFCRRVVNMCKCFGKE